MIAGDGPTVCEFANHAVEVDFTTTQHDQHITRVVLRIIEPKPDHGRLTIALFQRLKLKIVRVRDISLRVVCCSLFFRHV